MFWNRKKNQDENNDKIYKFVYETKSSSRYSYAPRTLIIAASTPAIAVQRFYKMIDNDVCNIIEFTEVNYTGKKTEGVEDN